MGRSKRKKPIGACHVCARVGRLSWEHVPPEAAFNDRPVIGIDGDRAIKDYRKVGRPRGPVEQRGAGGYTLCRRCNSNTGSWYGAALVEWCRQAGAVLEEVGHAPALAYPYYFYPLRVIKEIAAMFFSVNDVQFRNGHHEEIRRRGPELAQFVLNPERRDVPKPFRLFTYFVGTMPGRGIGWSRKIVDGREWDLTEITFPPLGYVMTAGTDAPHPDQEEITSFGSFRYDDFRMMHLKLPMLPVASVYPGDYRTAEEVQAGGEAIFEIKDAAGQPTSWRAVKVK